MADRPDISWGIDIANHSVYDRNLPHWRQEGAVYFVTFRLADSIPRSVLKVWQAEREDWLTTHGLDGDVSERELHERFAAIPIGIRRAYEREQARKLFVELDACHGSCHLRHPRAANVVAEALRHFHGERLYCGDFAVMPNHVHWLLIPMYGYTLGAILQSVKRWTANQINRQLELRGSLWQKESFDHIVRSPEELERIRLYIRENPSKAVYVRMRPSSTRRAGNNSQSELGATLRRFLTNPSITIWNSGSVAMLGE
jgi:type I restriction enzyme R subunit